MKIKDYMGLWILLISPPILLQKTKDMAWCQEEKVLDIWPLMTQKLKL